MQPIRRQSESLSLSPPSFSLLPPSLLLTFLRRQTLGTPPRNSRFLPTQGTREVGTQDEGDRYVVPHERRDEWKLTIFLPSFLPSFFISLCSLTHPSIHPPERTVNQISLPECQGCSSRYVFLCFSSPSSLLGGDACRRRKS